MRKVIEVFQFGCDKCGHCWIPRNGIAPAICPRCKSKLWDSRGERSEPLKESQPAPAIAPTATVPAASAPDADQWLGWTDERTTYDTEKGENVTYRQHIKSGRREVIHSETAY